MSTADDSPRYYRMREQQEREAARTADTEESAAVHLRLADKYAEMADAAERGG